MMSPYAVIRLTLLIFVTSFPTSQGQTVTDVRNLKNQLFVIDAYDKAIRPVVEHSSPIRIHMDLHLLAINEVNTVQETLRVTAFLELKWTDAFLTWNPSDYNELGYYHWPQDNVWKPAIALKNSYSEYKALGDKSLEILNLFTGYMHWSPFQVFTSTCSMNVKYYPFDKQTCFIEFAAWGYGADEVQMAAGDFGVVTNEYENNTQWQLLESSWEVQMAAGDFGVVTNEYENNTLWQLLESSWEVVYATNDVSIRYTIVVKREPAYVLFNVLLPILFLTLLNIFVFILPCESGERVGYAVTVFLSFAVFFTLISGVLPESVAIFTVYVIFMTAQSAVICLITIVEVRLTFYDDDTHPVPKWLAVITTIEHCNCFPGLCKTSKVASNKSATVEILSINNKEKGLEVEGNEAVENKEERGSSKDKDVVSWKTAVSGLDWILVVFFTLDCVCSRNVNIFGHLCKTIM